MGPIHPVRHILEFIAGSFPGAAALSEGDRGSASLWDAIGELILLPAIFSDAGTTRFRPASATPFEIHILFDVYRMISTV
jgi:hypothetical protein